MKVAARPLIVALAQGVGRQAGDGHGDAGGGQRCDDAVDGHRHLEKADDVFAGRPDKENPVEGTDQAVGDPSRKERSGACQQRSSL